MSTVGGHDHGCFRYSPRCPASSFLMRHREPVPVAGVGDFQRLIGAGDGRPKGILFRQIATPNYELRSFLRQCRRLGFDPVILEWHEDRMSCHNSFKRALVAPVFVEGVNRRGQPLWRRRPMTQLETVEKLRLNEVCVGDWDLPSLHRTLLRRALPDEQFTVVEGSDWFARYPGGAREWYRDLFLALTAGVVLFEVFVTDPKEADFFSQVVRPAYRMASEALGGSPSIISLCSNRRAESIFWNAYPASYLSLFRALGVTL